MFESPTVETQLSQYLGSDTSSALIENSDPVIEAHELQESNLSMNIKHVSILGWNPSVFAWNSWKQSRCVSSR